MRKFYPQHKNRCYCCTTVTGTTAERARSSIKKDRKIDNQTDSVTPYEFIKTANKYDIRDATASESVLHESDLIGEQYDLDDCNLYRLSRYIID